MVITKHLLPTHKQQTKIMKAIIFARVSTKEQEIGHSIDAQLLRLREHSARKGLTVVKEFKVAESSTRGNRKQFYEMLDYATSQGSKVAIVADAIDRIQRSFKESARLIELIDSEKIQLHFYRENIVIDKHSDETQEFMYDLGVIGAKSTAKRLRGYSKRNIEYKIKRGEWSWKAPLGYKNEKDPATGKSIVVLDEDRHFLIKKMFEEYATGAHSIQDLAKLAKQWGLRTRSNKPFSVSQVHNTITNPFYYGIMRIKGELHPHVHSKLINKGLFDACQDVLRGRKKQPTRQTKRPFIFRGLVHCSKCGCAFSPEIKKNRYVYLRPTKSKGDCDCFPLREETALESIKAAFKSMQIPETLMEAIRAHLASELESKKQFQENAIQALRTEQDKVTASMDKLLDLFIAGEGSITQEIYNRKLSELKQKQADLEERMRLHMDNSETFNITLAYLIGLASRAYELFESSEVDEKRQLLGLVFSNLEVRSGSLSYSMRKPFDLMPKLQDHSEWLPDMDSNHE